MNQPIKRMSLLSFVVGFVACIALLLVGIIWNERTNQGTPAAVRPASSTTSTAAIAPSKTPNPVTALPTAVGQCATTAVSEVTARLEDGVTGQAVPGSGSQILYTNGGRQVSYDTIQGIEDSRAGDQVTLCLKSIPMNCPPGDARGKVYTATNLRTHEQWEASDSEHDCGGA